MAHLPGQPNQLTAAPRAPHVALGRLPAMEPWLMWTVGLAVALLPVVLMLAFNRGDVADSRGRRRNRRWRVDGRQKI